ncbi:MAG: riboflavin synthase subunit alpha [Marmoricola sp.]|nr:riboflavin synthase subunit alpha [Marmoricola sp.]
MFTGIIEELGYVHGMKPLHEAVRLSIEGPDVAYGSKRGDSIAVNGVCLTVVANKSGIFTADVMLQTLANTSLGALTTGSRVNLERAVTPATRLGGHIVQGHVDGTGQILTRTPSEHWELVEISLPVELNRYLVDKGSITVDGISLTVADVSAEAFTVSLIPETLARTTLGLKQPGDLVNLEVDVIAKYVEKMVNPR